jgi:hypothetical protein
MKTLALLLSAALLMYGVLTTAEAQQAAQAGSIGLKLTPILETSTTVTGQPIRFPQGDNQFTAVLAEVAPGGQVGRHMHPVPLFVYILEGTLSIEMEGHGIHTFKGRPRPRRGDQHLAQRPQSDRPAGALPDSVLRPEGHAEPDPPVTTASWRSCQVSLQPKPHVTNASHTISAREAIESEGRIPCRMQQGSQISSSISDRDNARHGQRR